MVVLVIIVVGLVGAVALVGLRSAMSSVDPVDSQRAERWLIAHAPSTLRRTLRSLDRRVVGGVLVAVSFIVVFATAIIVGWILSGTNNSTGISRWDLAAGEWGRDNATVQSTRVLDVVTQFGSTIPLIGAMVLIGVYFAVRTNDRGPAIYLVLVGVGVTTLNNGLKLLIDRDRPEIAQLAGHAGSSFPSGHSAASAACWAAIALVVSRRMTRRFQVGAGAAAVFIACSVATSRVLLGVHWLSDVVAGVLVGWAWFLVTTIAVGGRSLRLRTPVEHIPAEHIPANDVTDERSVPDAPESTTRINGREESST